MWITEEVARKTCRRLDVPGHAHELTFSCPRKLALLGNDRTRGWLVESIGRARVAHSFDLWAYVIMPDHVHMIVRPRNPEYSVSTILRAVKQPVAQRAIKYLRAQAPDWLPRLATETRHGPAHQFWQPGGGYDRNITSTDTLWEMISYIHLNPDRRGLVPAADEWRWSGAGAYEGRQDVPLAIDVPPTAPAR